MAIEGSVVGWVANHRRHHVHSDRSGDPHSPHTSPRGALGPVRGFLHAHMGWMFGTDTTAPERYAADVLRDRDLAAVSTLFPLWAVASLALPFGTGWLWSGSLIGGLTAFVWAAIIRMALLHHVTSSVTRSGRGRWDVPASGPRWRGSRGRCGPVAAPRPRSTRPVSTSTAGSEPGPVTPTRGRSTRASTASGRNLGRLVWPVADG
jgi:fatty acid desaturase